MESRHTVGDVRSSDSYDVLVVGAGLAGLAFTLAMENSGLRVAVVDRNPSPDGQALGWGNDLQPNGIAVLDSLGVLAEAKHEGAQHYQWFAERFGGALLSRCIGQRLPCPALTVEARPVLSRRGRRPVQSLEMHMQPAKDQVVAEAFPQRVPDRE